MQQLFYLLKRFKYLLLFIFLEIIALIFTFQYHNYHQSKFINSANFITGGIYKKANTVSEYFFLKTENHRLAEENIKLKNLLNIKGIDYSNPTFIYKDSVEYFQQYEYSIAKVINNNYSGKNNYLTIDKGSLHGISEDLGVINSNGVVGVINKVSKNYATVFSILNSGSKMNVRLKKNDYFGTMVWDGKNSNITQIVDLPRQALLKVGDTIITGGKSAIFPEGINIGIIEEIELENNYYSKINVKLFNDMTSLGHVQIIKNFRKEERQLLEQSVNNE